MKYLLSFEEDRIVFLAGQGGKHGVKVKQFAETPLPEGGMRNGRVMDPALMADTLRKMSLESGFKGKKVTVVMRSRNAVTRETTLPYPKSERQLVDLIYNDLSLKEENAELLLADYLVTGEVKKKAAKQEKGEHTVSVLLFRVERACVEEFMKLLKDAGLKCGGIQLGSNCDGKLLHMIRPKAGTVILLRLNRSGMDLRLVDHGVTVISRSIGLQTTMFTESGALDILAAELADQTSKMAQFQLTRKADAPAEEVFLLCGDEIGDDLMQQLTPQMELPCTRLTEDKHILIAPGLPGLYSCGKGVGALVER